MEASPSEAMSTVVHGLFSIQWLEEGVIIASIGLAFILAHWGLASAKPRKPRKACECWGPESAHETPSYQVAQLAPLQKAAVGRFREPEQSTPVTTTHRVPQTSTDIPGVTDCRFVGQIISYKEDEGYGFISCPELYPRFQRDVFLHKFQISSFKVGATVSFGVFLNKTGQPQAKDLKAWQDPYMKRQPLNPHAKPFEASSAGELSDRLAVPCQNTAIGRTTARWKQWPSAWEELSDTKKQWTPPGKSDHDSKGRGEKRWVPKVKADIAAGAHGEGQ